MSNSCSLAGDDDCHATSIRWTPPGAIRDDVRNDPNLGNHASRPLSDPSMWVVERDPLCSVSRAGSVREPNPLA